MQLFLNIAYALVKHMHHRGRKKTLRWPSWPLSHAYMLYVVSSTHAVKIAMRLSYLNPGLTLVPSGRHIFTLLGMDALNDWECVCESASFPPSEPGWALSKSVLIDFEVAAVGNASHC